MSDIYWKRCPEARLVKIPHGRSRWSCRCHGDWDKTLLPVPAGALLIEHPEKEERTWYCARFGIAGYAPDISERCGHLAGGQGCGWRLLIELAAGEGER